MIDYDMLSRLWEWQRKYYDLLATHQTLVHEYESFKNWVDTFDPTLVDDYESLKNENRTGRGMEAGSVPPLGLQDN